MGFDGQAFATAFLNSLSGGIQERVKEAKEFGERERERAKRSMKVYKERKMKMKADSRVCLSHTKSFRIRSTRLQR